MTGETNLEALLGSMSPELADGVYVFTSVHPETDLSAMDYVMSYREAESITLILRRENALAYGVGVEYPCRQITLNIHSSLEAVGFLAAITSELAGQGISVNAVSAFYHDHLFVPEDRADEAMNILKQMAVAAQTDSAG